MTVYDSNGRVVDTVLNRDLGAGEHQVTWNLPSSLASGTYYYQLNSVNGQTRGRFVAMR
jgi:hypothetical protein